MGASDIFILTLVVIAVSAAIIFNRLVGKRQMVKNGWSDIDVQLKRRADLIPQFVNTVKGYAKHERALFQEVAEKRNAALAAGANPTARGNAESALSAPVKRMIALGEDYPELKASDNFLELQRQLAETEDKIEMARRFYNGAVHDLNTLVTSVPSNFIARMTGFRTHDYFEADERDRAAPSVAAVSGS